MTSQAEREIYYASFAPDKEVGDERRSVIGGKEKDGWLNILFGCCECSVVGCRISMTVFLVIVTCILSIVCSIIDIANDGKDTDSFLFWFFVLVVLFFCCDTFLIAFLCAKGLPCIRSNTALSYGLLPFYLAVQIIFVIFLGIQLLINLTEWTLQLFEPYKGVVPLWLDILHIVVNTILIILFTLSLCLIGGIFLVSLGLIIGKKIYNHQKLKKETDYTIDDQMMYPVDESDISENEREDPDDDNNNEDKTDHHPNVENIDIQIDQSIDDQKI